MTLSKTKRKKPGIVVNVFILYLGGGGKQISEFKVNLVYRVSSRTAKATQRNPVSKQTNKQTNTKATKPRNCLDSQRPFTRK